MAADPGRIVDPGRIRRRESVVLNHQPRPIAIRPVAVRRAQATMEVTGGPVDRRGGRMLSKPAASYASGTSAVPLLGETIGANFERTSR
jgi:hypothetical protein